MTPRRLKLGREALFESTEGECPAIGASGGRYSPAGTAIQRERILAAMTAAAAEEGYRRLSVQSVLERAGVSRPTFYEHFADKEDCFLAALDAAGERFYERISEAAQIGADWRARLRSGIVELVSLVAEQPDAARMLIIEGRAASPSALDHRDALLDRFASCVARTVGDEVSEPAAASGLTPVGVIGGIESLLYSRLYRDELDDLASLVPSLMYFAVLPYLGPEAAQEEMRASTG